MKKSKRLVPVKKTSANRSIREARVDYVTTVTVRAIYRQGKLELQKPVAGLEENEVVELVFQPDSTIDRKLRAIEILRRAKLRAIEQAPSMTIEEARNAYERAAAVLHQELRQK